MGKPEGACRQFLRCSRPAACRVRHPVLGGVPTCAQCAEKMVRLGTPESDILPLTFADGVDLDAIV